MSTLLLVVRETTSVDLAICRPCRFERTRTVTISLPILLDLLARCLDPTRVGEVATGRFPSMTKPLAVCVCDASQRAALPDPGPARSETAESPSDQRVWVLRVHRRVSLRQSHAVVSIDWRAGLARTSCGLGLQPDEVTNVPMGGCMPCVLCVAATPTSRRSTDE